MPAEHYFAEKPETVFRPKLIRVRLAGREVEVQTAGGIFSPDRLDLGTSVLLEQLALAPKSGNILDVGCGWGPIALSLAMSRPEATIWAIDVNERSLELTEANAKILGLTNLKVSKPEQVPNELEFSGIWSNPPIRVGKSELHDILRTWLPRLSTAGEAYLVVQKNLGSDSLQRWLNEELVPLSTERLSTAKSYRILKTVRS